MKSKRNPLNNDRLAAKIADYVTRCKQVTVHILQRCERRCTLLQKKMLLILFILLFGGYCAWTLLKVFYPKHTISRLLLPRIITLPVLPWPEHHPIHKPHNQ